MLGMQSIPFHPVPTKYTRFVCPGVEIGWGKLYSNFGFILIESRLNVISYLTSAKYGNTQTKEGGGERGRNEKRGRERQKGRERERVKKMDFYGKHICIYEFNAPRHSDKATAKMSFGW